MKKIMFTISLLTCLSVVSIAQNNPEKKQQSEQKEHVCTQACHDSNKHVYSHDEKGHVCDKSCMPKKSKKMKMKEHVCSQECHDTNKHVYKHGEKGHVCTDMCK